MKHFTYKGFVFFYTIKKLKYLRLKIDTQARLILNIPTNFSWNLVYKFLDKHQDWIKNNLQKLSTKEKLKANETYFLGKKYTLILSEKFIKTKIFKKEIQSRSLFEFEQFLNQTAQKIFYFYIRKWQNIVNKKIQRIHIKTMQTRWGSCNHKKAYINLNLKLLQRNLKEIEYVILHELTHLIYPHHQKEFYDFLTLTMPDFKQREDALKIGIF